MSQYESFPTGPENQGGYGQQGGHGGHQPARTVSSAAKTMSIVGIVLGVLSLLFLPIVLGPIGAVLGFVAYSQGDRPRGLYVGIGCIVATIAGMIIGAVVFSSMSA